VDEVDADGDGFNVCQGDCGEGNPDVHPGAVEVCNGLDDDCNESVDEGISAPQETPVLTATKTAPAEIILEWSLVADATGYDAVKGSLGGLVGTDGDFTSSVSECLENDLAVVTTIDLEIPSADQGLWYLVRAVNSCGGNGTYDDGGGNQVGSRDAEIDASAQHCP
jgi:hypothetical protein